MPSVRCRIQKDYDNPEYDRWVELEIGRDKDDNPYWKVIATSHVPIPQFTAKKGTWFYYKTLRTLKINSRNGNTEEFSLRGISDTFYLLKCGQTLQGAAVRPGIDNYVFRIDPACKPRTSAPQKKRR